MKKERSLGLPKARPNLSCRRGLGIKIRLCLTSPLSILSLPSLAFSIIPPPLSSSISCGQGWERAHLLLPKQKEYLPGTQECSRPSPGAYPMPSNICP